MVMSLVKIPMNHRSSKQDLILVIMANNGGKINYKRQDVYKNEKTFNIAMRELVRQRMLKENDTGFYPEFIINDQGRFYVNRIVLR